MQRKKELIDIIFDLKKLGSYKKITKGRQSLRSHKTLPSSRSSARDHEDLTSKHYAHCLFKKSFEVFKKRRVN